MLNISVTIVTCHGKVIVVACRVTSVQPCRQTDDSRVQGSYLLKLRHNQRKRKGQLTQRQLKLQDLEFEYLRNQRFTANHLHHDLNDPLNMLIGIVLDSKSLHVIRNNIHVVEVQDLSVNGQVKQPLTQLLHTRLLNRLVMVNVNNRMLRLPNCFLLFYFLASTTRIAP